MNDQAATPNVNQYLLLYTCHKQVWAAKIMAVMLPIHSTDAPTTPGELKLSTGVTIRPPSAFFDRHNPQAGGYFVHYQDGYESYSPAEPFESGYSLLSDGQAI